MGIPMTAIIITVLSVFFLAETAAGIIRKNIRGKLFDMLETNDLIRYDSYSNKRIVRLVIPRYTLLVMKLNQCISNRDKARIDEVFDEINRLKLNNRQAQDIYLRGFKYYLAQRSSQSCTYYKDKINRHSNHIYETNMINACYDVIIAKDNSRLDEFLRAVGDQEGEERYMTEYLISEIYRNMGDEENAEIYTGLFKRHQKELNGILNRLQFDKKKFNKGYQ